MRAANLYIVGITALLLAGLGGLAYWTQDQWRPWLFEDGAAEADDHHHGDENKVTLSPQAQRNLGLKFGTFKATTYWRTVGVPGAIVEPPGGCGYMVTAPVT